MVKSWSDAPTTIKVTVGSALLSLMSLLVCILVFVFSGDLSDSSDFFFGLVFLPVLLSIAWALFGVGLGMILTPIDDTPIGWIGVLLNVICVLPGIGVLRWIMTDAPPWPNM